MTVSISGSSTHRYPTVVPPPTPAARIPLPAGPIIQGVSAPRPQGPPQSARSVVAPFSPSEATVQPSPVEPPPEEGVFRPDSPPENFAPITQSPVDPTGDSVSEPEAGAVQGEGSEGGAREDSGEGVSRLRPGGLTEEEYREVQELKITDRQVRQHEQAHLAAGGRYVTGGPTYRFVTGPDGRQYAVAGEVSIDTSKEATPEETLIKAQVVRRAALAPPEPSAQDRSVAARATQLEAEARREILSSRLEEIEEADEEAGGSLRAVSEDFEFTRIGPAQDEDEDSRSPNGSRTPIAVIPVPLPPEARTDIGRLIDFRG